MTDPVRVPSTTSGAVYPLSRQAAKRNHAVATFATHPTLDLISFEITFPSGTESVTVSREEMLMPMPRDFEAWKREVEAR